MFYSKFDQEVNAFICVDWASDPLRECNNKGIDRSVITNMIAVAFGSVRLRELSITEIKRQFKRGFTMLEAYEIGRKESFDCL